MLYIIYDDIIPNTNNEYLNQNKFITPIITITYIINIYKWYIINIKYHK